MLKRCEALIGLLVLWAAPLNKAAHDSALGPHSRPLEALQPSRTLLQVNSTRYDKPWTICTSEWLPMVVCVNRTEADYDGYQIALWREVAADMGLAEGTDWSFECMDWDIMIDDLTDANGNCTLAAAGVEVSMINVLAGIKFSWPFYKSGLQVMISSHMAVPGTWSFFAVFHWSIWVVIVSSAVAVMFIINLVEIFSTGGIKKLQSDSANRKGLRNWSWYMAGQLVSFQTHVGDPKTWGSRVMVMGWAFLILILVHLFTAQTAFKMTTERLANSISGHESLPGRPVESWAPYLPLLRRYSINAEAMPWNNNADQAAMLEKLRRREYAAIVLDKPAIQAMAATAPDCDLYPVGDIFDSFELAIAYPPDMPQEISGNVSSSMVKLQYNSDVLDRLENRYMAGAAKLYGDMVCPNAFINNAAPGESAGGNPQIVFSQVLGLWYILLGAAGIALCLTAYEKWRFAKNGNRIIHRNDSFWSGSGYGGTYAGAQVSPKRGPAQAGSAPSFSMDTSGIMHGAGKLLLDNKPSRLKEASPAKLFVTADTKTEDPRGIAELPDPAQAQQSATEGHNHSEDPPPNEGLQLTSMEGS